MSIAPSAEAQLSFLNHIQRLFEEGEFVATYKYALLIALAEIAVEKGDDTGVSLHIPITDISSKFIELYWRQVRPYKAIQDMDTAVLLQNQGRQAAIPNLVAELQDRHASLAEAKSSPQWGPAIRKASKIIKEMPLWKLQTLRRQKVTFLYNEQMNDGGINLLPGVTFCLRQFNSFILQLARSAWVNHIRSNPRNRSIVGDDSDLDAFMFGVDRGSLFAVRCLLAELQKKRCFYCQQPVRDSGAVDHFIPWVRYPRDITQNFVLAHQGCNGDKRDLLAACKHLAHWRERNEFFRKELSGFSSSSVISDEITSLGVARWAYAHAHVSSAQVWVERGVTESLGRDYQRILA